MTFSAFSDPHGASLPYPLVLLELDALPATHRIDKSAAFHSNLDWPAAAGAGFIGPWRSCTPGASIVVEAVVSCPLAVVYVQSSANGSAVVDSTSVGNLNAYAAAGFSFTTTQAYYRIVIPVGESCRGSLRTQQRA